MSGERLSQRCGFEWGLHVCKLAPEHPGQPHQCGGYLSNPVARCVARTDWAPVAVPAC